MLPDPDPDPDLDRGRQDADRQPLPAADLLGALADRLGVRPFTVAVALAAVVVAGVGAWWALRAPDPVPAEEILPRAATVALTVEETGTEVPDAIVVHVAGAVAAPGVHELSPGARVVDAITAAGGMTDVADRSRVNLAAPVTDGQRLWVPLEGEEEPGVIAGAGGPASDGGVGGQGRRDRPVDINTADTTTLEQLPGIGPTLAAAIVEHRLRVGPFRTVDSLIDVAGIGPARLEQLRPLVIV